MLEAGLRKRHFSWRKGSSWSLPLVVIPAMAGDTKRVNNRSNQRESNSQIRHVCFFELVLRMSRHRSESEEHYPITNCTVPKSVTLVYQGKVFVGQNLFPDLARLASIMTLQPFSCHLLNCWPWPTSHRMCHVDVLPYAPRAQTVMWRHEHNFCKCTLKDPGFANLGAVWAPMLQWFDNSMWRV